MMPRRLPILIDHDVSEAAAERLLVASHFETKVLSSGPVSCKSGCSNCCFYPVMISILEGISIYQWLANHGMWSSKLKAHLQESKEQTWDLASEVWLLGMYPCPFLKDDQCSVYEARPLLCRTTFSRGDPYYCHPHRLGAIEGSILSRVPEVDQVRENERKVLKRHRLKPVLLPVAAAVLLGERIVKDEVDLADTNMVLLQEYLRQ